MNVLQGLLLGLIQGLTEFLPISSTAHLTLAGKWMGVVSAEHPEHWTAFIAVIQLGTMAAVLIYFARDVLDISLTFLEENVFRRMRFKDQSHVSKLGWYVILGSVPVATFGLIFKKVIEGSLTKSLIVIAASLIVFGILLGVSEVVARFSKNIKRISWLDALVVGFAQVMALVPGASRSGTTITAGLFMGMTRETAARFSFLLSIPAVMASGLLEFRESLGFMGSQDFLVLASATLMSAVSGYLTIAFLLRFLRRHSTNVFVVYRVVLGGALLWMVFRHGVV
ncbi:MAG TPA: undecaprenyl-diphosphatase UppP [Syntrophobacter fumaroxidans]|nr:undecaprenyl-diphosphatase UppP [Syntrophobacter fumaroxidans]